MKTFNVVYQYSVEAETQVKAKTIKEAIAKVREVLPDVNIGKVWVIEAKGGVLSV